MSNVLFIGDLHLDHKAITKYRTQFSSVKEHNEFIIDRYQSTVSKRDVVWLMGDVSFSKEGFDTIKKLKGDKRLIIGNHDRDNVDMQHIVDSFDGKVWSLLSKYNYFLSHPPLHPQELRGRMNIHGHVHTQTVPDDRYFNVSCEAVNYTPISKEEIDGIFKVRFE